MSKTENFSTLAIHGNHKKNPYGALNTPIFQTSTFEFENTTHGGNLFSGKEDGFFYSRMGNPTVAALEEKIALLEGGEACIACSSGMGAISSAMFTILSAGDHLLADSVLYGCTFDLFANTLPRFGVEVEFVNFSDLDDLKKHIRPNTKSLYFESPANPSMKVADIEEVCKLAHTINPDCIVVTDNTFCSPYITRPLSLGMDIVIHSATKYLNGHGDVLAGFVVANKELISKIKSEGQKDITGSVMSPFDAFLILRGLKTLKLRMDAHCSNAQKVAEFLEAHDKIEKVYYPGLESFPGHEIAKKQMRLYGAMISFEIKGGMDAAKKLLDNLSLCTLAVSLGDAETLIQHPASMTHAAYTKEEREAAGFTDGLVRLSVGLEEAEDIISDLEEGLKLV